LIAHGHCRDFDPHFRRGEPGDADRATNRKRLFEKAQINFVEDGAFIDVSQIDRQVNDIR